MHVSLNEKLEKMVKEKGSSGLYSNNSEVISEALHRMLKSHEVEFLRLERLHEGVAIGTEQI